jgi:hypothetical protein
MGPKSNPRLLGTALSFLEVTRLAACKFKGACVTREIRRASLPAREMLRPGTSPLQVRPGSVAIYVVGKFPCSRGLLQQGMEDQSSTAGKKEGPAKPYKKGSPGFRPASRTGNGILGGIQHGGHTRIFIASVGFTRHVRSVLLGGSILFRDSRIF